VQNKCFKYVPVRVQVCHGVWNTLTEQATSILSRRRRASFLHYLATHMF